ncbi:MalY/PatB family protein [Pediococcus cellicola]|uniref:cysteine-S-conjugate beta-lyase n=1 Tax=Pediococcus cellicola TaxID=319652 RepID=A0A0R2IJ60_9LACO|nr:PatB family C-S lyase [Pediococcus cellicola]KRN65040.1 cystathionine beta-lyase [Pediococcus cellicola]GEL15873.1 aminotransferase [Pediococcus cellicola]
MNCNFDKTVDRTQSFSEKWDLSEDVFKQSNILPMWVADTDFMPPEYVTSAIIERVSSSPLGYTFVPSDFFKAITSWYLRRHKIRIKSQNIVANATVMSSINLLLRSLTQSNDSVLVFSPVYFPFFNTICNLKRKPIYCDLKYGKKGLMIDFNLLEQQIKNCKPKVLLFCNPHNPGGRVWDPEELEKLLQIMKKYEISIISDEIHGDLVFPSESFNPLITFAGAYKKNIFTLSAPTKTFNIAGLKSSFMISYNPKITEAFTRLHDIDNYPKLNTLAITATIAAFNNGDAYLDNLNEYIFQNYCYIKKHLDKKYSILPSQGTFLLFIHTPINYNDNAFYRKITKLGLGIQMGSIFGSNGQGYFRINIGTTKKNIKKAIAILNSI